MDRLRWRRDHSHQDRRSKSCTQNSPNLTPNILTVPFTLVSFIQPWAIGLDISLSKFTVWKIIGSVDEDNSIYLSSDSSQILPELQMAIDRKAYLRGHVRPILAHGV